MSDDLFWTYFYELYESIPRQGPGLDAFERRHAQHPEALAVAQRSRHELDLFRRYADLYGYTFFVLRR
jgi:hypothetical protein